MSGLLIAVAVYIVLDRICVVYLIDKPIPVTRGSAILSLITGAAIVWIVLAAALGGVTP